MEVVDLNGGETIATGPITHRILEDGTHTGHRIGLLEVRIAPGTGGAPVHIHHEHDETFFVVSGTPSFTGGGGTITAQPGTLVTAAAGTPHGFANPGEETAVILATVTPDFYIDFFRELANLRAGPTGFDPDEVGEIMTRYATEVVRPASQGV
jgi:mannose-6-phosphate isomerase-like protein (cupin superfamily)